MITFWPRYLIYKWKFIIKLKIIGTAVTIADLMDTSSSRSLPGQVNPALCLTFFLSTCSSSRPSGFSFLIVFDNFYFNSDMFSCVGDQSNIRMICFFNTKKQTTMNAHHSYARSLHLHTFFEPECLDRPSVSQTNDSAALDE